MKSNYKKLGEFIQVVSIKNTNLEVTKLLGVSITKKFIPSIANTIGTDMSKYKIVKKNQFTYGSITSRNGDKISVALLEDDEAIVSTSYTVFEVIDKDELLPEYLMMWFRRTEFDRYARYMSHGSTREAFGWDEMCEVELPIPSPEKQKEIVKEYHTIEKRIQLNEQLNQKLEETAQAIYKEWFVDFEFPDESGKPYKSSGGEMVYCDELDMEIPVGWEIVELEELLEIKYGKDYKHLENGEIPLYGSGGIMKYVNEALYDKESILIPRKGSLNNIIYINDPFWSVDTMFYSKSRKKYFIKYLFHILNKIDFYNLDVGSAVPSMTTSVLNNLTVLKPIDSLVEKFDNLLISIFKHMKVLVNENNELLQLKEILLSKMATIEDIK